MSHKNIDQDLYEGFTEIPQSDGSSFLAKHKNKLLASLSVIGIAISVPMFQNLEEKQQLKNERIKNFTNTYPLHPLTRTLQTLQTLQQEKDSFVALKNISIEKRAFFYKEFKQKRTEIKSTILEHLDSAEFISE